MKKLLQLGIILIGCCGFGHIAGAGTKIRYTDQPIAISAPRPDYPLAARARNITGAGVYVLRIDRNGHVSVVDIAQSSGHKILDDAAVMAFKRWLFKPGPITRVRIPITWSH